MLSETLVTGLENYRIGPKIRALRAAKGLSLVELGDHTDLSAGMLSKIERGSVFPTLPTLLRVSLVFGVGLDHFFVEGEKPVLEVVLAKDRLRFPNTTDRTPSFFFESLDFPVQDSNLDAFLATFQPRTAATDPHEHNGDEFLFVISGSLCITIHNEKHELNKGDSMYFDARYPHSYKALGEDRSQIIVCMIAGES